MSEEKKDALPELRFPAEGEAQFQVLTPDLMNRFFAMLREDLLRPRQPEPPAVYVSVSYLDAADKAMAEGGEDAVLRWAAKTNTNGAWNACLALTGRVPIDDNWYEDAPLPAPGE